MRDLLSPTYAAVLAQLASSGALLAFDFDGTLAPIVDGRDDAVMRDRTASLFTALCALYPCAVISGRRRADVAGRLGGAAVKFIVGNHGLEPGVRLDEHAAVILGARQSLAATLAREPDIELEDKRYSLSLHYRRARDKREVRAAIMRAVSATEGPLRVVPGKDVVNLVPASAPNKGDALLELRAAQRAETALYVGDDATDEDVFALDQPGKIVSVRVGASLLSSAEYYLRGQQDIDRLLAKLVALRRSGS